MDPDNTTVLFAELPGFSGLSADLSSKDFNALLKEYYLLTDSGIRLHQGVLSSFSGDTFMAVFNAQNKHLVSELLALEAVSEIRERIDSFFIENKIKNNMGFKAGIACGNAIIGELGADDKKQITVMGEAVIRATRLREFADSGQVLVGGVIFNKANEIYHFQKLEPLPIRGTKETLPVYELLEKKRIRLQPESFPERKIASRMVGRSREMEQIESLIKQLLAGKGSIVNIVGKAGIGKSRLMAEIKAQPIIEKMILLEGRAIATGMQLSYHPIANLIRNWAGILEDDLPSVSAEKLQQSVQKVAPEQAEEIFSFTAKMMGLPLTGKHLERVKGIEGEALEKLIFKNLRDLVINATKDKPRIYLIEDMHWSDQSSLNLLKSLYKLSLIRPVMFVNVMRPGYADTGDYMLKYLVDAFPENHTTIHIGPLIQEDAGQLITNLLRKAKLPKATEEMIIRKTEGNPFFIEEVLRSFIDDGIIEIREGHFRVTEKIKEANIPDTINEAILSRVDKLDEKTRELLNTASVMGRNFYYKVLEEATDTIEELDDRLAYLSEVQLITETKKKEEIEYLFKHALAQQLTYDAMMQQSRKDTHLKIARSIEKVFAANINEFYGILANHYEKAENKEKAEEYLIKAGDEAVKSGAPFEAIRFYEDALKHKQTGKLTTGKEEEIKELEIKIAFAYEDSGNNIVARSHFEVIMDKYFGYRHPQHKLAILYYGISNMLFFMFVIYHRSLFFKKKVDDNFHLFMRVVKEWGEATATADPRTFAMLSYRLLTHMSKYRLHDSIRGLAVFTECNTLYCWTGISFSVSQKILEYGEQGHVDEHPISQITYRQSKIMHDFLVGKWNVSNDFEQVFNQCIARGQFWPLTIYTMYTGLIQIELGNFSSFMDCLDKMNDIYNSFDNQHARAQMFRTLAYGYYRFRKMDEALSAVNEGIEYTQKTGHNAMLMLLYCSKTQIHAFKGDLQKAKQAFLEADKLIENHKIITIYYCPYLLAKVKLELGELKILDKRSMEFKKQLNNTLKSSNKLISKSKKMAGSMAEAYLVRAEINKFLNKSKKTNKYLNRAIETGEKFNGRLELSRAYFETGKFLSNPKTKQKQLNGLSGKEYLEKAKIMFEEMDLQWDLEEYRKFLENMNT